MGAGEQIRGRLDALEKKIDRLLAHLGADRPAGNGASGAGAIATLAQIQGEHGDFEVGKPPKNWKGDSFEGYFTSECPPDFLDFYADFLDWKAGNPRPGKEKYAKYDSLNAARCRRWAIEIREGRHKPKPRTAAAAPPPPPPDEDYGGTVWSSGNAPPSDDYDLPPPPEDDLPF